MNRWTALLGCFIGMAVSMSSMFIFPFGLYMKSVTSEFGWSRTQYSAILSLIAVCNVVALPLSGIAVDRFGRIRCILIGLLLGCSFSAALSVVHSYWAFVAIGCLASMAGCLALYPAYFSIVRGWFDRNLGLALAFTSAGVSVGVAAFSFLIKARIDAAGWRNAVATVAGCALIIGLANLLCLVRENKGPMPASERLSEGSPVMVEGKSLSQAVRTRAFWLFSAAFLLIVFAGAGPNTHLPALVSDRGGSAAAIAAAVAAIPIGAFVGRIVTGVLIDRFPVIVVALIFCLGQALGILMLWAALPWTAVAAFLIGMAQGAELDMMGFVMARRFGRLAYARIFGTSFALSQLGLIIGPVVMAAVFDANKSYDLALLTYPLLPLVAIVLIIQASARSVRRAPIAGFGRERAGGGR